MAKLNKANLKTKINERFPDNNTRYITAAISRSMLIDFVDSLFNDIDDDFGIPNPIDTEQDADLIIKSGVYFNEDWLNAPFSSGWIISNISLSSPDYQMQLWQGFGGTSQYNQLWHRFKDGGTFTTWKRLDGFISTWNTTDELPEGNQFDEWYVPTGGWTYDGNYFEAWKVIKQMVQSPSSIDDYKIY